LEAGHKESIRVEFPFTRNKIYLLAEVIEGMDYDIPDPAASMDEAREIIRELVEMIRKRSRPDLPACGKIRICWAKENFILRHFVF